MLPIFSSLSLPITGNTLLRGRLKSFEWPGTLVFGRRGFAAHYLLFDTVRWLTLFQLIEEPRNVVLVWRNDRIPATNNTV